MTGSRKQNPGFRTGGAKPPLLQNTMRKAYALAQSWSCLTHTQTQIVSLVPFFGLSLPSISVCWCWETSWIECKDHPGLLKHPFGCQFMSILGNTRITSSWLDYIIVKIPSHPHWMLLVQLNPTGWCPVMVIVGLWTPLTIFIYRYIYHKS
jgi:hypothetical protein